MMCENQTTLYVNPQDVRRLAENLYGKVCLKITWKDVSFSHIIYYLSDYQRLCKQLSKLINVQGRAKEKSPCLKIPALVLPGNLASPCTANQPISESLSSILSTQRHFFCSTLQLNFTHFQEKDLSIKYEICQVKEISQSLVIIHWLRIVLVE